MANALESFRQKAPAELQDACNRVEKHSHIHVAHFYSEILTPTADPPRPTPFADRLKSASGFVNWQKETDTSLGTLDAASREESSKPTFSFDLRKLIETLYSDADKIPDLDETQIATFLVHLARPEISDDAADRDLIRRLRQINFFRTLESIAKSKWPASQASNRSNLEEFGENLLNRDWESSPLVGKYADSVLEKVLTLLAFGRQVPVLLGEAGVGKTAIVEGLAYFLREEDERIPQNLSTAAVLAVSPSHLFQSTSMRGELEKRFNELIGAAMRDSNIILFLDELHMFLDTSQEATRTVANLLKPVLRDRRVRCIGATTRHEFDRFVSGDIALTQRLVPIDVHEPPLEDAKSIVRDVKQSIIAELRRDAANVLEFTDESIGDEIADETVELTNRYMPLDKLPRKAINLLRTTTAAKAYELSRKNQGKSVALKLRTKDVAQAIADYRGLPLSHILDPSGSRITDVESKLSSQVFGQPEAIRAIVDYLVLEGKGWTDSSRPLGVFLFAGPAGVGKRTLAAALAEAVMGHEDNFVEFDLASIQSPADRSSFFGAPPSYVGYGETPTVFSKVRTRPGVVVLLRNADRADFVRDGIGAILSGTAQDSQKRETDFRHALIVLTVDHEMGDQAVLPFTWNEQDPRVDFQRLSEEPLVHVFGAEIAAIKSRRGGADLPADLDRPETLSAMAKVASVRGTASAVKAIVYNCLQWKVRNPNASITEEQIQELQS